MTRKPRTRCGVQRGDFDLQLIPKEHYTPLKIESRHLGKIAVVAPQVFEDERGYFMESFRGDTFKDLGLPQSFVQENHSYSRKGVLRGLHFQWDPPMGN
jgi:dTDP-4-dehydrorhamnose 3,5-epimerase